MAIIIHAIADDHRHWKILRARLTGSGFTQASMRSVPAGIHRLVRNRGRLYCVIGNRLTIGIALASGVLGTLLGAGFGFSIVASAGDRLLSVLQQFVIIVGTAPIGTAIGLLAGLIVGICTSSMVVRLGSRRTVDEPVMLSVKTESVASAKAAETILNANGAHEIRIARIDR